MIEFARLWAFVLLPLPILAWFFLPPAPVRAALRVPSGVQRWMMVLSHAGSAHRFEMSQRLTPHIIGWLCLVASLAGPYTQAAPLLIPTGRDLVVAVDLSASMAENDVRRGDRQAERVDVVRDLVGKFIANRSGDRVALIAFATDAFLIAPLTFDTGAVANMLDEVAIGLPGRKTDLGRAIGLAVQVLKDQPPAERLLVVLSDGETNTGALSANDAAALAAEHGITVHVIGFSGAIDSADVQQMRDVATLSGGRYFAGDSAEALRDIYEEIDEIAPVAVNERPPQLVDDWTFVPLVIAFAMLVVISWREARGS